MIGVNTSIFKSAGRKLVNLLGALKDRAAHYENGTDSVAEKNHIDDLGVLDKATILLTPTATSDARVHSVKTYTGDELVTNGTYSTDLGGWTNTSTHWQWSSGSAYHPLTTSLFPLKQDITNNVGAVLRITFDLTYVQGTAQCFYKNEANSDVSTTFTSSGSYTIITEPVKANTEINFGRAFGHNTEFYIDNVSVVDVSSDFDFDRASSATRINSSGLVQDMQSITDPELVLNGDFEELGDEEVTNGTFDADSDWTKGTSWSIGDGIATSDGGASYLTSSSSFRWTVGKTYKVSLEITEYNSGSVSLPFDAVFGNINYQNSSGVKTAYIVAAANSPIYVYSNNFDGKIDNVSVQQVDPNNRWTLSSTFEIDNGKLFCVSDGSYQYAYQGNAFVVGNTYKITFDVIDYSSGSVRVRPSGQSGYKAVSANGTYTQYFTATDTTLAIERDSACRLYIDNISVKDITFSTDVDLARINYDSNGDNGHILLEPTSTNLITYSEDFSESVWSKVDVLIEGGYTAPDGSNNAYKVTKNGSNAHLVGFNNQNTSRHKSIWAKTVSGTGDVYLLNQNTNNLFSLTNEWQRFDVAHTGANWFYAVDFRNSALTEVIVWGAQLEALPYATSYIPNHGTAVGVTRAAETLTGSGNSTLINSTEGVLYAEIAALDDDGTDRKISLNDGTYDNQIVVGFSRFSGNINAEVFYDGDLQSSGWGATSVTQNNFNKFALSWQNGNYKFFYNGVKTSDQSISNTPIGLSQVKFSYGNNTQPMFCECKALAVFNEALTDDELELLTGVTNYGSFSELASANGYTII